MNRIAVVIPSFNHARYIAPAIESALNQTRKPDRIIVVDDGSTDASPAILRRLAIPPITLIEQPNNGAHAAIARGVQAATDCDIIAILNSDDLYLPGRLAACEAALDADPARQLVVTGLCMISAGGHPLPPESPRRRWLDTAWADPVRREHPAEWLGFANFAATTSNFVARAAWLRENPPRPYRYVHDYDLLLRAALTGGLHVIPDVLLEYRVHETNTITDEPHKIIREVLLMNLALAADLAPLLRRSPDARAAWARYLHAAPSNISSFRFELFALAAAEALAAAPPGRTWADTLRDEGAPEFTRHPNTVLIDKPGPSADAPIAARVADLKSALRKAEADRRELARIRDWYRAAASSRWISFGVFAGALPAAAKGKSSADLARQTLASAWFRLGLALRVPACVALDSRLRVLLEHDAP